MKKHLYGFAIGIALVVMAGCAALGMPTADQFNEKVGVCYITVAEIRTQANTLAQAGAITKADAINIQASADAGREGCDVARAIGKSGDLATAEGRLNAARTGLSALQVYLAARKK